MFWDRLAIEAAAFRRIFWHLCAWDEHRFSSMTVSRMRRLCLILSIGLQHTAAAACVIFVFWAIASSSRFDMVVVAEEVGCGFTAEPACVSHALSTGCTA
jgi:hypothetical protein